MVGKKRALITGITGQVRNDIWVSLDRFPSRTHHFRTQDGAYLDQWSVTYGHKIHKSVDVRDLIHFKGISERATLDCIFKSFLKRTSLGNSFMILTS